jgi:hypothetical protein
MPRFREAGLSLRLDGPVFVVSGPALAVFCYAIPCDSYQSSKDNNDYTD